MPVQTGSGAVMLTICTGEGTIQVALDPVTMDPLSEAQQHDPGGSDSTYCDWSAANPGFTSPDAVAFGLLADKAISAAVPAPATILRFAAATGLPPSTGPPSVL